MKKSIPKRSRWQEIVRFWAKISKIQKKKINKSGSRFFEEISKINKHLSKLTKRQREISKLPKPIVKGGNITDTEEIHRSRRTYFKNMYSTKLENLKESDSFFNTYHLPN